MLEGVGDDAQYVNVFAYATDSERYRRDLVEDSKAPTTLDIVGKGHTKLRSIEMEFPVKQVLNSYARSKDVRKVRSALQLGPYNLLKTINYFRMLCMFSLVMTK